MRSKIYNLFAVLIVLMTILWPTNSQGGGSAAYIAACGNGGPLLTCQPYEYYDCRTSTGPRCYSCPVGDYCDGVNNNGCPSGGYSLGSATSCINCPAGQGKNNNGDGCEDCTDGRYAPSIGFGCQRCNAGYSSTTPWLSCNVICLDGWKSRSGGTCRICQPGTYGSADHTQCTQCDTSWFVATSGSMVCYPCPDGETDSNSNTDCQLCSTGQISTSGNPCVDCNAGFTNSADHKTCIPCNDGYTSQAGRACIACSPGTISNAAHTSCSPCNTGYIVQPINTCVPCNAGYTDSGHITCVLCGTGEYSPQGSACLNCNPGFTNNAAHTGCDPCLNGYIAPTAGSACSICLAGTYANAAHTTCTTCNAGYIAPSNGATSCSACNPGFTDSIRRSCVQCAAGKISASGDTCHNCPDGYTSNAANTVCDPCPDGYISSSGSICNPCSAGTSSNSIHTTCSTCSTSFYAATAGVVCSPCDAGKTDTNSHRACQLCNVGYYSSSAGLPCSACSAGTTSIADHTGCTPCTPGTSSSSGGACNQCNVGFIAPNPGDPCTSCGAGTSSDPTFTSCVTCPTSYKSAAGAACVPCSAGETNDATYQNCVPCPAAYYSTSSGVACSACLAGKTSNALHTTCVNCAAGSSSASGFACSQCPTGQIAANPGDLCSNCAAGTESNAAHTACVPCSTGYISAVGGTCQACGIGLTSNIDNTVCVQCSAGWISVSGASCTACAIGRTSNFLNTACQDCPAGSSSNLGSACFACDAGQFSSAGGTCSDCPTGTYGGATGVASCTPCSQGTYNGSPKQPSVASCLPCSAGYFSGSSAISCTTCSANFYQESTGQSSCVACPQYSSSSAGASLCSCNVRYFLDRTMDPNYCQECHEYCLSCSGNKNNCGSCIHPGLIYDPVLRNCTCNIDNDYYESVDGLGVYNCMTCGGCANAIISDVKLYNEWTKLDIKFTGNVVYPTGITNNSPQLCDALISGSSSTLFGSGYSCSLNANILTVVFGIEAQFTSTSTFQFKYRTVRLVGCMCYHKGTVSVTNIETLTPSLQVTPSYTILACSSLQISTSNIVSVGKRFTRFTISYQIVSATSSNSTYPRTDVFLRNMRYINSLIMSANATGIIMPEFTLLESGIYNLRITLQTFIGSYVASVIITTQTAVAPNLVFPVASGLSVIHEWDPLVIAPNLQIAGCASLGNSGLYSFNWTVDTTSTSFDYYNNTLIQKMYSSKDGVLTLPSYTFTPERWFNLKLVVTHRDIPFNILASYSIRVIPSEVIARISGGDTSINTQQNLTLNGSSSNDSKQLSLKYEIDTGTEGKMSFVWTCENITNSNKQCEFANGTKIGKLEGEVRNFNGSDFYTSTMKWTLLVKKGNAIDSCYAIIDVLADSAVQVGINTVKDGIKVNRDKMAILSASVYSTSPYALSYSWESEPKLPLTSYANGVNDKFLKILPYNLDEGARYTFTCTVTESSGSKGYAVIRVLVNRAPRLGQFKVSPTKGISKVTKFELRADGWIDDDLPFTYLFSYYDSSANYYFPISSKSTDNMVSTTLSKSSTQESLLILKLEIFDSMNGTTVIYTNVTLEDSTVEVDVSAILSTASDTSKTVTERLNILSVASKGLNCEGNKSKDTECTQLLSILKDLSGSSAQSAETDSATIGILSTSNIDSGEQLNNVIKIVENVAAREKQAIINSRSVNDEQLDTKKVQYGLSQSNTLTLLNVVGKAVKGMSDIQMLDQQNTIMESIDILGRSLVKDHVPHETPITVSTPGITITAQKISRCPNSSSYVQKGTMKDVNFELPICDIIPVNKTEFDEKTLNIVSPYDLIIQVFDRNVIGDCVPLPSSLIRVMLYDDTKKVTYSASGVKRGINFTFTPNSAIFHKDIGSLSCVYYNPEDNSFTSETLQTTLIDETKPTFRCTSTHLSEFALMYIKEAIYKSYMSTEFYILLIITIVAVSTHFWATYHDHRKRHEDAVVLNEKTEEYIRKQAEKQKSLQADSMNIAQFMPFEISSASNPTVERVKTQKISFSTIVWLIILRTNSLLRMLCYPSKVISKKACTQLFWNNFYLRLLFLTIFSQLMKSTFPIYVLIVMSALTAFPLSFGIEFAIRSNAKTNKTQINTEKIGELQAAIYTKMKLQGHLRLLGRALSYIAMIGSFIAITMMYQLNYCTATENATYIGFIFLYSIFIQDTLNCIYQVVAVMYAGWTKSDNTSPFKKVVMRTILKEVLEAIVEEGEKEALQQINQESNASNLGNQSLDASIVGGSVDPNVGRTSNALDDHTNNLPSENQITVSPMEKGNAESPKFAPVHKYSDDVKVGQDQESIEPQVEIPHGLIDNSRSRDPQVDSKNSVFTENNEVDQKQISGVISPKENSPEAESPDKLNPEAKIEEIKQESSDSDHSKEDDTKYKIVKLFSTDKTSPEASITYNRSSEDVYMEESVEGDVTKGEQKGDVIVTEKIIMGKVKELESSDKEKSSNDNTREDRPVSSNNTKNI